MTLALLVALGAAVGAVLRYLVDQVIQNRHDAPFPFGTFTINMTGAFALGLLTGLAAHHGLPSDLAVVLGTGLLGGYTTFSTWAYESIALLSEGVVLAATLNVLLSAGLGLAAGAAGLGLGLL